MEFNTVGGSNATDWTQAAVKPQRRRRRRRAQWGRGELAWICFYYTTFSYIWFKSHL